jgi:hypothetical protein
MSRQRIRPPQNAAQLIEELATRGASIIRIAKHFRTSVRTFKAWLEHDETLQESFDSGRDAHKDYLVSLVANAAIANRGANANAMFLLKTMHGFREIDSPNNKTNVNVAVATSSVMYVVDHGTDEEWAAKAAAQQRALVSNAGNAPTIIEGTPALPSDTASKPLGPLAPAEALQKPVAPAWTPPEPMPAASMAPAWKGNA